jgi:hypothetical protein
VPKRDESARHQLVRIGRIATASTLGAARAAGNLPAGVIIMSLRLLVSCGICLLGFACSGKSNTPQQSTGTGGAATGGASNASTTAPAESGGAGPAQGGTRGTNQSSGGASGTGTAPIGGTSSITDAGPCAPQFLGQVEGRGNTATQIDVPEIGANVSDNTVLRKQLQLSLSDAMGFEVSSVYFTQQAADVQFGSIVFTVTNPTSEVRCDIVVAYTLQRSDGSAVGSSTDGVVWGSMGVMQGTEYLPNCLFPGDRGFFTANLDWTFSGYDAFQEGTTLTARFLNIMKPGVAPGARLAVTSHSVLSDGRLHVTVVNQGVGPARLVLNALGQYVLFDSQGLPLTAIELSPLASTPNLLEPGATTDLEENRPSLYAHRFGGSTATAVVLLRFYDPNTNCWWH